MCPKWLCVSATVVGGALAISSSLQAAPRELVGINGSGQTVSSGWTWDVSAVDEPNVNLVFISLQGNNFFFEKDAKILKNEEPLVIRFNKISPTASNLVINDETVTNRTGTDWGSFRMELSSGSVGGVPNFVFTTSDGASGIGDFSIDPFKTFQFYNNNSGILVSGGVVKNGATWFPGSQSNTGLALSANNQVGDSFTLKEIAIPIPLPAAAWTGLTTLIGICAVNGIRRVRRSMTA